MSGRVWSWTKLSFSINELRVWEDFAPVLFFFRCRFCPSSIRSWFCVFDLSKAGANMTSITASRFTTIQVNGVIFGIICALLVHQWNSIQFRHPLFVESQNPAPSTIVVIRKFLRCRNITILISVKTISEAITVEHRYGWGWIACLLALVFDALREREREDSRQLDYGCLDIFPPSN